MTTVSARRWKKSVLLRKVLLNLFLASMASTMLVCILGTYFHAESSVWVIVLACGMTACIIGSFVGICVHTLRQQDYILKTFEKEDLGCLGGWIDVVCSPKISEWLPAKNSDAYQKLYSGARASLLVHLPRLRSKDKILLSNRQRHALYDLLGLDDPALILAVLQALPYVGDRHALPFLHSLALGEGIAATEREVQKAAQLSLAQLQEQLSAISPQILLRPSVEQNVKPEQLLQPVHYTEE